MLRHLAPVTAAVTVAGLALWAPAAAPADSAPGCAIVAGGTQPSVATPGSPCWTDVEPYPFGADGNPVDPTSKQCAPAAPPGDPSYVGPIPTCYLRVDSLAFRAPNRGLAATSPASGGSTAYGVWLYNGERWYPDPTFPGTGTCSGHTILWAGKLDYWLVGGPNWSDLCRFDGVNFEWEPIAVPDATLAWARERQDPATLGRLRVGTITAGACFSWNNCWFFGSFGVIDHWDGSALTDETPDLNASPWLAGDFTSATVRTANSGQTLAFAASGTSSAGSEAATAANQIPAQPDDSAPPQLYSSSGGAFGPVAFSPPAFAAFGDPFRTDLVAVDSDQQGDLWVAGNPVARTPFSATTQASGRRTTSTEPSPIVSLNADGTTRNCPALPTTRFTYSLNPTADSYLWSALSVVGGQSSPIASPQPGDALVGGDDDPLTAGSSRNDDGQLEPVIVDASCDRDPVVTRFREPDPTAPAQSVAPLVPADRTGWVTSMAAPAANDAWAATTVGHLRPQTNDPTAPAPFEPPHLYHLTDGTAPLAPNGDDNEPRPLVFQPDPAIVEDAPPEYVTITTPDTTVTKKGKTTRKTVVLKPAVYDVTSKVKRSHGDRFTLTIRFRVRRKVTLGVQALRHNTVVSTSGLKHFSIGRGKLVLRLSRRHYPTKIRFVAPKTSTNPKVESTR